MLLEFSIRDTYFFSSVKAILQHFIFYITLHIQLHLFPAWRADRVMPPVKWLFASLPLRCCWSTRRPERPSTYGSLVVEPF